MQNAYKFKNCVGDPDILLSPDTLLSPTKGGALSRAHGRPTIISSSKKSSGRAGGGPAGALTRELCEYEGCCPNTKESLIINIKLANY